MSLLIQKLSLSFAQPSGWLNIIQDLSLSLLPGRTVGLVGESGCGKSLTALSILRLLPPHAGYGVDAEILLDGVDILNVESHRMRDIRGKRISMVFQEPMVALNPVRSMYHQIADVLLAHQTVSKAELKERILTLMQDVELPNAWDKLQQYPHQWSGGQKQRFLIAMALANRPQVLLADEPTTALDIVVQKQLLMLLKKLQKQYGLALLLISHNFNVVRAMADQVVVMYAGQMIENAPAQDFWRHPRHPYVHQLIDCLPSFEKRRDVLTVIPGNVPNFFELPSGCRFHPRCAYATQKCQIQEPQYQHISENHWVRCHLYPRTTPIEHQCHIHQSLPTHKAEHDVVLEVKNLWVTEQNTPILQDVSFKVYSGRSMAIVGESGCGKTTLANTLMGLHPYEKGDIQFAHYLLRKDIQLIFQDPASAMNPRWTIAQILKEGLHDYYSTEKIKWILDAVQMPKSCLECYPHELSGGQKQRIAIARALLGNPKVLICDEPTSALDISVQAQILNLLKKIQHDFGLTLIIITHDLGVVGYLADEILILKQGCVIEKGAMEKIWLQPEHEYTKYLLSVNQFFEEEL
jgi:peptide/nickel transport system ATP-binding protein